MHSIIQDVISNFVISYSSLFLMASGTVRTRHFIKCFNNRHIKFATVNREIIVFSLYIMNRIV